MEAMRILTFIFRYTSILLYQSAFWTILYLLALVALQFEAFVLVAEVWTLAGVVAWLEYVRRVAVGAALRSGSRALLAEEMAFFA